MDTEVYSIPKADIRRYGRHARFTTHPSGMKVTIVKAEFVDHSAEGAARSSRYFVSSTKTPFQSAGGGFSSNTRMRSE